LARKEEAVENRSLSKASKSVFINDDTAPSKNGAPAGY
jgi:hypothetical protein